MKLPTTIPTYIVMSPSHKSCVLVRFSICEIVISVLQSTDHYKIQVIYCSLTIVRKNIHRNYLFLQFREQVRSKEPMPKWGQMHWRWQK